jgi:hypothetical protein
MAKYAAAFQDEVRRLARKEAKALAGPALRAVAQHRREIAQLKRQLRAVEKKLSALKPQALAAASAKTPEVENGGFAGAVGPCSTAKNWLVAAGYGRLSASRPDDLQLGKR